MIASTMGNIMAVVAAFEIHIERMAVVSMKPNSNLISMNSINLSFLTVTLR